MTGGQMQPTHGPRQKWPLPIRRELITADAWFEDGELVIQLMCDCASVTAVRFVGELPTGEFALSCSGCHTSHWITVRGAVS